MLCYVDNPYFDNEVEFYHTKIDMHMCIYSIDSNTHIYHLKIYDTAMILQLHQHLLYWNGITYKHTQLLSRKMYHFQSGVAKNLLLFLIL